MQSQDYIERMIQQVAAAIASVLGCARSSNVEEAQRELDNAWFGALGLRRSDLDRLDAATLSALLGSHHELATRLLDVEAQLRQQAGDTVGAEHVRALARSLG